LLARFYRALDRHADRRTVKPIAGFGAHDTSMAAK
jgi:hypothetical protein